MMRSPFIANQKRRAAMGLLDNLLGSMTSGQNSHSTIGSALLGLLASESGRSTSNEQSANQSPVAISGGLNELVQRFEQSGLGDVIQSWIGSGANQPIGTDEVHRAIGPDTVARLSEQTGMGKAQLLPLLAQVLPTIVDRLTPNQRVPDQGEISRMPSNPQIET
jgi:uncharacterized protein YidB (DUF937 family)